MKQQPDTLRFSIVTSIVTVAMVLLTVLAGTHVGAQTQGTVDTKIFSKFEFVLMDEQCMGTQAVKGDRLESNPRNLKVVGCKRVGTKVACESYVKGASGVYDLQNPLRIDAVIVNDDPPRLVFSMFFTDSMQLFTVNNETSRFEAGTIVRPGNDRIYAMLCSGSVTPGWMMDRVIRPIPKDKTSPTK